MSTTTSNSQSATASTTASPLSWPQFFDTIVITNLGTVPVWIATDGGPAMPEGAGMDVVLPGAVAAFGNRGIRPDVTRADWPGTTQVSVVTASGTAEVCVSPQ